jgi:hypothetical protein
MTVLTYAALILRPQEARRKPGERTVTLRIGNRSPYPSRKSNWLASAGELELSVMRLYRLRTTQRLLEAA